MSIDWFTVLAQIANFWLLVWLLRRFLYRPILEGIAAREAEIARRLTAADAAREEALAAQQRYHAQRKDSLAQQQARVDAALQETRQEREALLARARAQREQEQASWRRQLDEERAKFEQSVQENASATLIELADKVLHDLADDTLEAAIVRQMGTRLESMAAELAAAAGTHQEGEITTHARLSPELQAQLTAQLQTLLPGRRFHFRADPQQSPGFVLQIGGARIAWTLAHYLQAMQT